MGCEAPWWCAIGVAAGSWIVDPPVAHRIAATWGQEGEENEEALHGEDAGGGSVGTRLQLGSPVAGWSKAATTTGWGSASGFAGGGIKSGMTCGSRLVHR